MVYPVDRFAAHLAHLLNAPDQATGVVALDPGRLFATLTATLSGPLYARELLHQPGYAWRMAADEAAMAYFNATLGRRLRLSGRSNRSVAHRAFEALLTRGQEPIWATAEVIRCRGEGSPDHRTETGSATAMVPPSFGGVRDALAAIPQEVGTGNAAITIRARHGPLGFRVGPSWIVVPEEMGVWDAILCAPPKLKALGHGEAFNRFCSVIIDAMRTANRPVQELLGLGRRLCPFDWIDSVPVNQVRALRRFLAALPDEGKDTPEAWASVFAKIPVPGHKDVKALWNAPIAQALRNVQQTLDRGIAADWSGADAALERSQSEEEEAPFFLDEDEFAAGLERVAISREIRPAEKSLLLLLYRGSSLPDALSATGLDAELARLGTDMAEYVEDLYHRVHAARASTESDHK